MAETKPEGAQLLLRIPQGADWKRTITVQQNGTPLDITNYKFSAEIRKRAGLITTGTLMATFSVTITDGPAGEFEIALAKADVDNLETGGQWDLFAEDSGGEVSRWFYGRVELELKVTQADPE
jgi:hypothetical protein